MASFLYATGNRSECYLGRTSVYRNDVYARRKTFGRHTPSGKVVYFHTVVVAKHYDAASFGYNADIACACGHIVDTAHVVGSIHCEAMGRHCYGEIAALERNLGLETGRRLM